MKDRYGRTVEFTLRRRQAIRRWSVQRHILVDGGIGLSGATVRRFTRRGAERYIARWVARERAMTETEIYTNQGDNE